MLGGVLSKSVTPGSWRARALVPAALVLAALPALAQEPIWIEQLGTARWDGTIACAPDGSGGVFAGGSTYGNLAAPVTGYIDAWLGRYDDAGHLMWIRQFGASGIAFTWGLASDASGGVYACGYTGGDLGGPSAGLEDVWLARFDGAGGQLWMRQFGTSKEDYARAATPDGTGGVYVTGDTHGPLGGPSLGTKDAWIARFDSSGNQLWVRQLGTSSGDISQAAAPDGMHGVYIGGYTSGALAGAHVGNYDAFLARTRSSPPLQMVPAASSRPGPPPGTSAGRARGPSTPGSPTSTARAIGSGSDSSERARTTWRGRLRLMEQAGSS